MCNAVLWRGILISGLLFTVVNCLPAYCQNFFQSDQFFPVNLSEPDKSTIGQQLKAQFPVKDMFEPWKITHVDSWENSQLFKKNQILQITVCVPHMLECEMLPSGGSIGIFAFDGKKLIYLNGSESKKNLGFVFKNENSQLELAKPIEIASLFCISVLRHSYDQATVLFSPDNLKAYGKRAFGGGYTLNVDEFNKCAAQIKAPQISGNKEKGWKISFYILRGRLHDTSTVCSCKIDVSPQFNLNLEEKVLSTNIFSSIPKIQY